MRQAELTPVFVDDMPERLEEGRLYVSERHSLAMHLCCCGCREEVVTPLSPAEWSLTVKNGKASLSPSVGNWGLPCRSHYWVRSNRIDWAGAMSDRQIEQVWARDRRDLAHQAAARNANLSIRRRAVARLTAAWSWVCSLFGQSG
jgi:hypothetical protein